MRLLRTPKDKAKFIIYASVVVITLIAVGMMFLVGYVTGLPATMTLLAFLLTFGGGLWLLGKFMDRSKYKAEYDELNQEAEEEDPHADC